MRFGAANVRLIPVYCVITALVLASGCVAQEPQWEVGAAAGFGIIRNAAIGNSSGSASAGMDNRFAAGVVFGQDLYQHLSGEVRYTFRDDDLVLKSGGSKVNMDGESHLVQYDMLFQATRKSSRIRPYAAAGAGIRWFLGTGQEYVNQPLGNFAFLTKTDEVKPLVSMGGGVKVRVRGRMDIRLDFRDYISPFPQKLFATAPGARIHGWLNDLVPFAGVSWLF